MKITKFSQSCLLVENGNRTALFDPGVMSESVLNIDQLESLQDIIITHEHSDHFSLDLVRRLVEKFPNVHITTTQSVVDELGKNDISAFASPSEGIVLFNSPHEEVEPLFYTPDETGVHYLDTISHPGDSHSFKETKSILALPVTAPWGATTRAVRLALELKPKHIVPIHDWHWSDQARRQMYEGLGQVFAKNNIVFHKMENGEPINIDL